MEEDIADLAKASVAGTRGEAFHDRGECPRRLAVSARRPGFALLVAETTVLVGCAYGFPVGPNGSSRRGLDRLLQESIQRLTARARFVVLTQVVAHPHAQRRDTPAVCNSVCSPTGTPLLPLESLLPAGR